MNKNKFLKRALLFVLTIGTLTMEAQNKIDTSGALNVQQQKIVIISALTATGDLESLKKELNSGLDAGLSINEIKEILTQLYAYCGFPRSLNGINTFRTILEERKTKGITDIVGKEIITNTNVTDKYEQGRKVLEILTNTKQAKPAPGFGEFAPRIDAFLKEHLFADIFECDVLTYQQRELVTISALTATVGVEPQLQAHLGMGKNIGITENQLLQLADLIEIYINKTQANGIRKLLSK